MDFFSDISTASLVLGVLFSAVGMAYFVYGKKQHRLVPFASGILLMVFPYFISNPWGMGIIGTLLMLCPLFTKYLLER